ncbi:MAG: hypothetical protein HQ530_03705 [Parcubacteria group bacterium]|nr:hypothetical protein [Parcubacteria group bacterium]
MKISEEQLEEFKKLYKKHFDKEISDKEALEQATKLVQLIKIIYKK